MALQLIRTIDVPTGTLPADTDWAGTLAAPGFTAWNSPNNNTKAYFAFRGFDADVDGNEIGLGDMSFDFASVVAMPMTTGSTKLVQFLVSSAFPGRSLGLEVDIPPYAVDIYPRIVTAGSSVPAALERLEIWADGAFA